MPDELWLNTPGMKKAARGKVVWRREDMAGIQFSWDKLAEDDRRNGNRQVIEKAAVVTDRKRERSLHGVVQNINASGCLFIADDIADMPDQICVRLETEDEARPATIVWRNGIMAGIEFHQKAEALKKDDGEQAEAILDRFMALIQDGMTGTTDNAQPDELVLDDFFVLTSEPAKGAS